MSAETKKGYASTLILFALGVIVLFAGVKSLVLVVPAAILIWYGARPSLGNGRN